MHPIATLVEKLSKQEIGLKSISDGAIGTTSATREFIFDIFAALTNSNDGSFRNEQERGSRRHGHEVEKVAVAKWRRTNRESCWLRNYMPTNPFLLDICQTLKISRVTLYRYLCMGKIMTHES